MELCLQLLGWIYLEAALKFCGGKHHITKDALSKTAQINAVFQDNICRNANGEREGDFSNGK